MAGPLDRAMVVSLLLTALEADDMRDVSRPDEATFTVERLESPPDGLRIEFSDGSVFLVIVRALG